MSTPQRKILANQCLEAVQLLIDDMGDDCSDEHQVAIGAFLIALAAISAGKSSSQGPGTIGRPPTSEIH